MTPIQLRPETRRSKRWRLFWLSTFLALVVVTTLGLSPFTQWLTNQIPASWEISLGQRLTFTSSRPLRDSFVQTYVTEMGAHLLRHAEDNPFPFQFEVVDDSKINAYALMGGRVSICLGLVQTLESPDQLAAVLSHEIGHILKRHSFRNSLRRILVTFVYRKFFNAHYTADFFDLRYSRSQELEADHAGMELMMASGFSGQGMIEMFKRLQRLKGDPSRIMEYLSTHPLNQHRIGALQGYIQPSSHRVSFKTIKDWQEFKKRCASQ